MLTLSHADSRLCDGSSRRALLRAGALGAVGLSLDAMLCAAPAPLTISSSFGRAKRCVLLFLTGGPPQLDTWDLKPAAPPEVRGEFQPIATNVPGIEIGELLPRLAQRAHRYTIVRSVTHRDTIHTSAGYTMLTGAYHPTPNSGTAKNIKPTADDHPHLASLVASVRKPLRPTSRPRFCTCWGCRWTPCFTTASVAPSPHALARP